MARVLVVRFSSLGDIILTFPALHYLSREKNLEVHYLTKESFKDLVALSGSVHMIHTIPDHASLGELKQKISELKQYNFEMVYDLHSNIRSRLTAFFLGRPYKRIRKFRIKEFLLYLFRRGLSRGVGIEPIDRSGEAFSLVAEQKDLNGFFSKHQPALGTSGKDHLLEINSRFPKGFVSICSESAWSQKQWPEKRFLEVSKKINALGFGVVWLGLDPVSSDALGEGAMDLTKKLSLPEVATILNGARALVCNDTGLMHLAEAVKTPVISVFGPTSSELGFAPRLTNSRIVQSGLWCRPCSKTGRWCFRVFQRRKCLMEVKVDHVLRQVNDVLSIGEAQ